MIVLSFRDVIPVRLFFFHFVLFAQPLDIVSFLLDVGGGSVSNKTRHSLARISLRWMIRECFKTDTGIMFNSEALFKIGLDPSTLHPSVSPRPPPLPIGSHRLRKPPPIPIPIDIRAMLKKQTQRPDLLAECDTPYFGTEEEEELRDALSPKYDQLKLIKAWWIIEILPFLPAFQRGHRDDFWVKKFWYGVTPPPPLLRSNYNLKLIQATFGCTPSYSSPDSGWHQSSQKREFKDEGGI